MCDHGKDIAEIKDSINSMASTHIEFSKSLVESAQSQAKIATDFAVYRERLDTIATRGCEKGEDMVTRTHRRMDDEVRGLNEKVDKVKDSNWWVKLFGGVAVVIATVISIFI